MPMAQSTIETMAPSVLYSSSMGLLSYSIAYSKSASLHFAKGFKSLKRAELSKLRFIFWTFESQTISVRRQTEIKRTVKPLKGIAFYESLDEGANGKKTTIEPKDACTNHQNSYGPVMSLTCSTSFFN